MKALPVLMVIGGLGVGLAAGRIGAALVLAPGSREGVPQANAALAQSVRTSENAEQKELEEFLKSARIMSVEKNAAAGRGAAWRISLRDAGGSRRGFFKYVNIRRPQISPISFKYELAAYTLSKLLQVPVIPPVVERDIEGKKGSLQIYLDNCISEAERRKAGVSAAFDPRNLQDALDELVILESLVFCDRNINDILIHKDSGRVCRVDFAEAFDPSPRLPAEARIARCSRRLYAGLRNLVPAGAEAVLKPYLNDAEIKGLLTRRTHILELLNTRIAAEGEAAVLFDLVLK
jgi:hypothetical protein